MKFVRDLIIFHEGFTAVAKPDEKGRWVIGYGHDIPAPTDPATPPSCTRTEAENWLDNLDLPLAKRRAAAALGACWDDLDTVRKAALTDMAYELGGAGLGAFHKMIAAIQAGDWRTAHAEALDSDWAEQVPGRAERDAGMILTGEWPTG